MLCTLIKILHTLEPSIQDRISVEAKERADSFCARYDIRIQNSVDAVYAFYLSKKLRLPIFDNTIFGPGDPIDLITLERVHDDYRRRVDFILNTHIQTHWNERVPWAHENLVFPPVEVVI